MGKRLRLYCIPGFLGTARDWDALEQHLIHEPEADAWRVSKLELFAPEAEKTDWPGPELALEEWADRFCTRVRAELAAEGPDARAVVLGYSLGGRLALQALATEPALWAGAVIVSAQPGLAAESERRARVGSDEDWAQRFESENWRYLLGAWNNLPVFGGARQELERPESAFSRKRLAAALRNWSVGRQADHWRTLERLGREGLPLHWMAGERDPKFAEVARKVPACHPGARVRTFAGAGHRLPWEAAAEFHREVAEFLRDRLAG